MKTNKIHCIYFSATHTTKRIIRSIAEALGGQTAEYDITQSGLASDITVADNELLLVGMPVYAGRIPARGAEALQHVHTRNSAAVIVGVYGNRDFDDALLEMKDLVEERGFVTAAAAAFIAQHSIFPTVGTSRPDSDDMAAIADFAAKVSAKIAAAPNSEALTPIEVPGNRPYKTPGNIPCMIRTRRSCNSCGLCVAHCPAGAISKENYRLTDKEKCLMCGRCVIDCPQHARYFGGIKYKVIKCSFERMFSARKSPSCYY